MSSGAEQISPRALFVDDEPNVLKALRRVFCDDDIEIAFAADGQKALDYLRQHAVDVILSDHNMPGLSGVEFLRLSREIQPEAIRMLITGRGDLEVATQAVNQGAVYKFFQKPWDDEDLRISLLRALEFKRAQEALRRQEGELARMEAYRQTMITVSHYINNFNCVLTMNLESLLQSPELTDKERTMLHEALSSAEKITTVLRILNRIEDLKTIDLEYTGKMFDVEQEVEAAVRKIEAAAK